METLNGIITMLGNGFFPIIVCGFLFWYVYKKDQNHKEEIKDLKRAIENQTKAIDHQTEAITNLIKQSKGE